MTLSEVANVANIVAALSLVVSAVAVLHELRQSNKLTKAQNTGTLVNMMAPFALNFIRDRSIAEFYVRGSDSYAQMDDVDQCRYRNMLWSWLVYHENVYYQWRQQLLDDHTYKAWESDLRAFIVRQRLEDHWDELKELFQVEFARHIDNLLKQSKKRSSALAESSRAAG